MNKSKKIAVPKKILVKEDNIAMKKDYVTLWLSVTTFDTDDVVTASVASITKQFGAGVDATEKWWSED